MKFDERSLTKELRVFIFSLALFFIFSPLSYANGVQYSDEIQIHMSFHNADLRDIFHIIGEISGFNIVLHQSVSGRASIRLDGVSFIQALDLITNVTDYDYMELHGAYFIAPPYKINELMAVEDVRLYPLSFIPMNELQEFLYVMLPTLEHTVNLEKNIIILLGSSEDLNRAQNIIDMLDREIYMEREFDFYSIQHGEVYQIASMLYTFLPHLIIEVDERSKSLLLWGNSQDITKAHQLLKDLDRDISKEREVKLYLIEDMDGEQISSLLSSIYPDLLIVVDEVSRNLILSGDRLDIQKATELLRELEDKLSVAQELQIYSPNHIASRQAVSILSMVTPALIVEVEENSQDLILLGSRDSINKGLSVLKEIDTEAHGEQEIVVQPLEHARASWILSILQDLLPELYLEVDDRNDDVILIGTSALLERALVIITRLDREVIDDEKIYFYPLRYVEGGQVAPLLRSLIPSLLIEEERGRNLIFKGRSGEIEMAKEILQELDQELMRDKEVYFQPLRHASGEQLAPILRSLVPGLMVEEETRSRNLILGGSLEEIEQALVFIQELDREVMEDRDFHFYPLTYAESHVVDQILLSLVPELLIEVDHRNNNLILSGSSSAIDQALFLLEELDQKIMEEKEVYFHSLLHTSGDQVAPLLLSLLPDLQVEPGIRPDKLVLIGKTTEINRAKELLVGFDQETDARELLFFPLLYAEEEQVISILSALLPELEIMVDPIHEELILIGKVNELDRASNLIIKLDRERTATETKEEIEITLLPVHYAEGIEISNILFSIFPDVMIEVDTRSNHLILKGASGDLRRAREIVLQLDRELLAGAEMQVVQLEQALLEEVSSLLAQMFPNLIVEVEESSSSLIIQGQREDLAKAESIWSQMETEKRVADEIRVARIRQADVTQMASLLKSFVPDLKVEVEEIGRNLILSGPKDALNRAEELLSELDQDVKDREETIRVFPIRYADTQQVSSLLSSLLPEIYVGVEERTRNLIIKGDQKEMERAEALLKDLDRESIDEDKEEAPGMEEKVKIFSLQHADAEQVGSVLTSLLPEMKIEKDIQRNLLIVIGCNDQLLTVESIITGLDQQIEVKEKALDIAERYDEPEDEDEEWSVNVYALAFAEASSLGRILETFIASLVIETDARTNSLIMGGEKRDLDRAFQLIKDLDIDTQKDQEIEEAMVVEDTPYYDDKITVIELENASALEMSRLLGTFFPKLEVDSLEQGNMIIIGGNEALLAEAYELIGRIDSGTLPRAIAIDLYLQGVTGSDEDRFAFIMSNDKHYIVSQGDTIHDFYVHEVLAKEVILRGKNGDLYALHLGGGFTELH